DQRAYRLFDRLLDGDLLRLILGNAGLSLENLVERHIAEGPAGYGIGADRLVHRRRGQHLAGVGGNGAQGHRHGVLLPFAVSADAEIAGAEAAGERIGVITDDAALQDDTGMAQRRQHAGTYFRLVAVKPAHLRQNLTLLEQVVEPRPVEDG